MFGWMVYSGLNIDEVIPMLSDIPEASLAVDFASLVVGLVPVLAYTSVLVSDAGITRISEAVTYNPNVLNGAFTYSVQVVTV